jgi:hypothetical protein
MTHKPDSANYRAEAPSRSWAYASGSSRILSSCNRICFMRTAEMPWPVLHDRQATG